MEALQLARLALRHPGILRPYRRILLVGHMRANSSLIGHILGSNPEIEGYYELHMGYHSWKSFQRQKLKYFSDHAPKPRARYLFDKVLHNDHPVNFRLFRDQRLLFTLREPRFTIPSTVRLYRRVDPAHAHASVDGAIEYYLDRVQSIAKQSREASGGFLYYDADALRQAPERTLAAIGADLGLHIPLSRDYKQQQMTGARRAGDSSESINVGTVISQQSDYSDIDVPDDRLREAHDTYLKSRAALISSGNCRKAVLLDD